MDDDRVTVHVWIVCHAHSILHVCVWHVRAANLQNYFNKIFKNHYLRKFSAIQYACDLFLDVQVLNTLPSLTGSMFFWLLPCVRPRIPDPVPPSKLPSFNSVQNV